MACISDPMVYEIHSIVRLCIVLFKIFNMNYTKMATCNGQNILQLNRNCNKRRNVVQIV